MEKLFFNSDKTQTSSHEQHKRMIKLLREHYKPSRLDRHDGQIESLASDRVNDLQKYGKTYISRHDAACNQAIEIYYKAEHTTKLNKE